MWSNSGEGSGLNQPRTVAAVWSSADGRECEGCCDVWYQEAENLISQKMHPQTIIAGWRKATAEAHVALEKSALDHG